MITGTYYFRSKPAAVAYYGDAREVAEALAEGRIFIGPPPSIPEGSRLIVIDDGLRYAYEDGQPFREGSVIYTTCNRGRIRFSQLGITGRVDYTPKPWRSFWNGTAGPHFATIEEAARYFRTSPRFAVFYPDAVAALKAGKSLDYLTGAAQI